MKLFGLFFRFEMMTLLRERTILWIAGSFFCLLCFGAYEGHSIAEKNRKEQKMMQSLNDARLNALHTQLNNEELSAVDRTPYEIGGKAAKRFIFKNPQPFAMISVGQSNIFESQYAISLRDPDFTFLSDDSSLENPLLTYLGSFDLAFVLIWLMPLVIILYMYNVVSEESEMGTLKLLLSHPITLNKLIAVKSLVRFTLFTAFLMASVLAVFLLFHTAVFLHPLHLGYLLVMLLLYTIFWFLVCILVNYFSRQSITNFSMLFVVFLSCVVIIPTITGLIADYTNPIPSRMVLVNTLRETTREIDNDSSTLLNAYYFDHPELVPDGNVRNMAQYVYKNALKKKMLEAAARPVVETYYRQTKNQMEQTREYIYASPTIALYAGMDALAQNGLGNFLNFQKEVDTARLEWKQIFENKIFKDELMSAKEIKNLPSPVYRKDFSSRPEYLHSLYGLIISNLVILLLIYWQIFTKK